MKNYYNFLCPNCKKEFLVAINPKGENICFSCPNCDEIYFLKELEYEDSTKNNDNDNNLWR